MRDLTSIKQMNAKETSSTKDKVLMKIFRDDPQGILDIPLSESRKKGLEFWGKKR